MFDWAAAEELLYTISKEHVTDFLDGPIKDQVYGVGVFCDAFAGDVYVVADTIENKAGCSGNFTDIEEQDKWDIGLWKYPGGLFPSNSIEQSAFDNAWGGHREQIAELEGDEKQALLEEVCFRVLRRLILDGVFSPAPNIEGFNILGPDDPQSVVLEKKRHLDQRLAQVWRR